MNLNVDAGYMHTTHNIGRWKYTICRNTRKIEKKRAACKCNAQIHGEHLADGSGVFLL